MSGDAISGQGPERAAGRRARVAIIDDHEITTVGFAHLLSQHPGIELATTARTVAEVEPFLPVDLAILDLRLSDGSQPADNVRALRMTGSEVLILTAADSADLIRSAARAGVIGVVRKSESAAAVIAAVDAALRGETFPTVEWAAAIDAAEDLPDAGLSEREREVLALYAAGEKAQTVAYHTGLSRATVNQYVSRIRAKYARVGRPAETKVQLNVRAREDGILP